MVDSLDVALVEVFHDACAGLGSVRSKQQVYVICHQAICMHRACESGGKKRQVTHVVRVIGFTEETRTAIDPALNDMHRTINDNRSSGTRHSAPTKLCCRSLTHKVRKNGVRPHLPRNG